MSFSIYDKGERKYFEPLKTDFEIPDDLQKDFNALIYDLNFKDGHFADCIEDEINSTLNGYLNNVEIGIEDLTREQIIILREYYCLGGIYKSDD